MEDENGSAATTRGWLAVAWFPHRRFSSITSALSVPCVILQSKAARPIRYIFLSWKMMLLLLQKKPTVLLVQNPSIACATVAVLLRPFLGYLVVVDAHNEAILPFNYNLALVRHVALWLMRTADFTVVTNSHLANVVTAAGGHPFVLFDPIPVPPPILDEQCEGAPLGKSRVVVVSTYAPDEPLEEICFAARLLSMANVLITVTGRPNAQRLAEMGDLPPNVSLAGYLSDSDYWKTLRSATVIVDLTRMPYCLVCGAYEAISVGKPLVLTDDPAGRELFGSAVVFSANQPESIAASVERAIQCADELGVRALSLRDALTKAWTSAAATLVDAASRRCLARRRTTVRAGD